MTTSTKRTRTRAVPRPAPSPLPTLEDYGLKARAELPGESWVKCWQQERAYTIGFRCGRDAGPAALLERWFDEGDYRRAFLVAGVNDGARVRERGAATDEAWREQAQEPQQ